MLLYETSFIRIKKENLLDQILHFKYNISIL